ncbi:MAG: four helix bundle protein [Lewinella sp.]|nr:four helix bundle protein [Lewinella sp.]
MTQVEFNEQFRKRTKKLSLEVIQWYAALKSKPDEVRIMGKQLIRSVTSTAANFRAACRARSQAERFAKL